ncbi:efflux RND transporter periplasmic adaptor subunit [Thioalkalivibrio sp. ALE11]|uniref:efflux RND transporter periplasmic adaptor subunit n=1 Tax=Thioalkalivibrio sp. ALE11 TaxID=1265494 RepID=UPI0003686121|nr:efflux RND transporter periplasmic adaptor subunit [Thioalkalivibrio sp. ALE11]
MNTRIHPIPHTTRRAIGASLALLLLSPAAGAQTVDAELAWSEQYRITAPVAGQVREIGVRPGDRVMEDDTLFRIDDRRARAELSAAQAEVERLELEASETERELRKARDLYDQTLIAERELELARIDHTAAESRLTEARARVRQARADVHDTEIAAPGEGRVLRLDVTRNEYVNPALVPPVLAVIGRDAPMHARGRVDADTAARLEPGHPVTVILNDTRVDGRVEHVDWERSGEEDAPAYRLRVEFTPPEGLAPRAGQAARIELGLE